MFVLDTNVISELRRRRPHGGVVSWLAGIDAKDLNISVSSIYEIQAGIELTRVSDPTRAIELAKWLDEVEAAYQVLPVTSAIARQWATLMHRRAPNLQQDALITATAMVLGLTVATRNTVDFEPFGVAVFNPFGYRH